MTEPDLNHDGAEPLVFPLGHYMGPFHPQRHEPPRHHIVRVGWDTPKLPDEAHLDIWALAHGLPGRITEVPWTRTAIVQAAEDAGMPDAPGILEHLAELGLIAELAPGPEAARRFAETHRMQTLLIGLGNSPDDPALDAIGLAGLPPVVKVRPRLFQIWQWAHLWPNLWAACEGLAASVTEAPDGAAPAADLDAELAILLDGLRTLIAHNAVYLDVVVAATEGARRAG